MKILSRRGILLGTGALACAAAHGGVAAAAPAIPSLGAAAAAAGLTFGAAVTDDIFKDPVYRQLYIDHARILTSDLALKFAELRPDAGAPRYAAADRIIAFAEQNGMAFRGHTLIWNESNPAWINALSRAQVGVLLDRHVSETVGHYAGRMHSWDVVNEPFWPDHHARGGFRRGPWFDALGSAYIGQALRRARAADAKVKLVVNEAFTERGDALGLSVRAGLLQLIDTLQQDGVPLDAIGLEAHLQPQFATDDDGFVRFLEAIASRRLAIYLTELDVDDSRLPGDAAARDVAAAARVETFLTRALSVPAVQIVECWELADRYSWYSDPALVRERHGALARPLPFDSDMLPKPMADAILRAFKSRGAK